MNTVLVVLVIAVALIMAVRQSAGVRVAVSRSSPASPRPVVPGLILGFVLAELIAGGLYWLRPGWLTLVAPGPWFLLCAVAGEVVTGVILILWPYLVRHR